MFLFFKKFLGFMLLLTTIGLASCQSLLKADPLTAKNNSALTVTQTR